MKKIFYLCFLLVSLCAVDSGAQEKSRNNIASQPLWGPTGYNRADYYYLPDLQLYYSVNEKKFVYLNDGKWEFSPTLPEAHSSYDLFSGHKVVINRPNPYTNFNAHKSRYSNFVGQKNRQTAIVNSNNTKYFVVEGHPKNSELDETKIGYTPKIK